jgi:hypothetical protein
MTYPPIRDVLPLPDMHGAPEEHDAGESDDGEHCGPILQGPAESKTISEKPKMSARFPTQARCIRASGSDRLVARFSNAPIETLRQICLKLGHPRRQLGDIHLA